MHSAFRHLRFGVKRIEPPTQRFSRAVQRALADELASAMGAGWRLTSRSHSRGVAAVALANPPITRLGIDVEYADPARPWREIAAMFLPEAAAAGLDPPKICRLWTFGEAHLKAFGTQPSADLLLKIAREPIDGDEPFAFTARRWWWTEQVGEFWLSLVWEEEI